ncbi:uncharacterized protein LOC128988143 [Macrosteles quadrilineatus]|uniref:uncharacterized protein LOC128988143 n=1 Tax=Macrosteles quadrilineatus TaxID=74068 RepID=UPI0023E33475|nr:uncharacterized protein LOC128988143 [Macrosteles quadrilineatus]
MYALQLFVLVAVQSYVRISAEDTPDAGPYKIHVANVGQCAEVGKVFTAEAIKEYQDGDQNRPCFTGNVNLTTDLNDEYTLKVQVQNMVNSSWKDLMSFVFKKACSDTIKYEANWFEIMKKVNIHVTECPIPKGFYQFKCVSLEGVQIASHKTVKYGKYRIVESAWDKDTLLGCVTVEGTASPN